jgi:hypothetical protein
MGLAVQKRTISPALCTDRPLFCRIDYLAGWLARRDFDTPPDAHAPQAGRLNGVEIYRVPIVHNGGERCF